MANQDQAPRKEDRRDSSEQSGSTGRNPGTGEQRDDGANTGQGQYGMTGGGKSGSQPAPDHDTGSSGTSDYGRSDDPDADNKKESNPGSGKAENDESMNPRMKPDKHRNDNENPG